MATLAAVVGLAAPVVDALERTAVAQRPTPADVVAWLAAAALVGLVTAVVLLTRARRSIVAWEPAEVGALVERVAWAEAALAQEQERLHQLRATITGITASHQLLRDAGDELPEAERRHLVAMYERELARLSRLVTPPPGDDAAAVDLQSVLDPMVASLTARGVGVRWDGTSAWAFARRDEVAGAVHALLENAVTHGRGRGVALAVETRARRVRIRVSDRGPGVPATLGDRIFDRGARGATSPGNGLGLHIARRVAVACGGDLALDRSTPAGTAFVLDLPGDEPVATCLAPSD